MLLLARIAERRSKARGQAAAPLLMCLLPRCFGAVNHSAPNQSRADRGNLALKGSPHLGSRRGTLLIWQGLARRLWGMEGAASNLTASPGSRNSPCPGCSHFSPLLLCHCFSSKTETTIGGHTEHLHAEDSEHGRPSTSSLLPHPSPGRGRQMSPRGVWKVSPGSRINQVPAHIARVIIYG